MMKYVMKTSAVSLMGLIATIVLLGQAAVMAQDTAPQSRGAQIFGPDEDVQGSEFVTINVKDANISEVLKAYSLQTGQSIVVGPDVVSDNVNVRLNNIPWQNALDVILKPYGFGYRVVGDTIVISKLENIVQVEGIEPLASKVFKLKYLDAYDIKDVCEAQLTGRGKFTILSTKGLPGWDFGGQNSGGRATSQAGVRDRAQKEQIEKSKTFIITDVPASLSAIGGIIEELDQVPGQVLIEARFLEINMDNLSDIGLDFITAIETVAGGAAGGIGGVVDGGGNILNPVEALTDSIDAGAQGMFNQNNGIRLSSSSLGDSGFEMLFKLQQKDEDINILSAPRVLTLDNQEAAMLVGQKYPIIESDTTGSTVARTSISLDYYENIGIQLNVLPQISDNDFINMVVHPVVSEIAGFTDGSVELVATDISSSTRYPILNVREAETQILLKSEETAVIGGLQTQRDSFEVQKVPFLGDIPFLGRLFRREIKTVETIDLLIFIKATIIDRESYVEGSLEQKKAQEKAMTLINKESEEESADAISEDAESAEVAEAPVAEEGTEEPSAEVAEEGLAAQSEAENDEILALVKSMDSGAEGTNQVDTVEM